VLLLFTGLTGVWRAEGGGGSTGVEGLTAMEFHLSDSLALSAACTWHCIMLQDMLRFLTPMRAQHVQHLVTFFAPKIKKMIHSKVRAVRYTNRPVITTLFDSCFEKGRTPDHFGSICRSSSSVGPAGPACALPQHHTTSTHHTATTHHA
jgi:hypothetical protein